MTSLAPARNIQAQCHGRQHRGPTVGLCCFLFKFLALISRLWGGDLFGRKAQLTQTAGVSKSAVLA